MGKLLTRSAKCPAKVFHIVENLDRGAVENWLLRMLAHARHRGVALDWTFYCTLDEPGRLDERAKSLSARVIHSPHPLNRRAAFARSLRAELKHLRPDVLHCHHDLVSGLYLAAAAGLPIRRRLVHVHNADESVLTPSKWKQSAYRPVLRNICRATADRIVGISNHTLDTFLAGRPRRLGRDIVHYYGVDPSPFDGPPPDRAAFRRSLDLVEDSVILLFGGRLVPEKNPIMTVDVLAALRKRLPNAVAVFAGAGSLEREVIARARELGVVSSIRLLGWRDDLANIMRCCDCFILPRPEWPMEGFGLAVVEAQLAGLHLLISKGVPDDPLLPTARFRRLSLSQPPGAWAAAAFELLNAPSPSPADVRKALAASPMNMDHALDKLRALHV